MANPPFNVDEVDVEKVRGDKRLPFGLPGVNKAKKVSNANYLWLSYFYGYLNENGRAGVVMSSQASSAGRNEARVRQKLVESGADWAVLREYVIPKPPRTLLKVFNDTVQAIAEQCKTLALHDRSLAETRDLLLPRLMNGVVTV